MNAAENNNIYDSSWKPTEDRPPADKKHILAIFDSLCGSYQIVGNGDDRIWIEIRTDNKPTWKVLEFNYEEFSAPATPAGMKRLIEAVGETLIEAECEFDHDVFDYPAIASWDP